MQNDSILALAGLIGFVAGLRSLTAPAAVSWGARLGWLQLQGSALAFMGSAVAVVGFSLLAVAEYLADLHPRTPSRTAPGPLMARVVIGGLSGACLCASDGRSLALGAVLGGTGGLVGAFAGYWGRTRLVAALKVPDHFVALSEDLVAIALGLFVVSR